MKVILSAAAEAELEEIADWIAEENPRRALRLTAELRECCEGLKDFPERFSIEPRYRSAGVRRRPHSAYLIFYRIEQGEVQVLHILHGARDYEDDLFRG